MKISLSWLCDHIDGVTWSSISTDDLVALFNQKVAEIEFCAHTVLPSKELFLCRVSHISATAVTVVIPESGQTAELPVRTDLSSHSDAAYVIRVTSDGYAWVTLQECGLEKDGLVPAVSATDAALSGSWRYQWEAEDYILDVDNKSLTHRPDMWGHRGFAREVAALLNAKLVSQKQFLSPQPVVYVDPQEHAATQSGVSVAIKTSLSVCSALGASVVPAVDNKPCDIKTVSRFLKVGYRPINALVDITNYAMADWGHPLHAYDQARVKGHSLTVRMASEGEALELLDGATLELTKHDVVVCDAENVLGLAGIMGGKHDSVSSQTAGIILEAGCFHAATTRRSAAHHKIRTEASQRFEKTLDPEQVPYAILRAMHLAEQWGVIDAGGTYPVTVIGKRHQETIVTFTHDYLTQRLGISLVPEAVCQMLTAIELETRYADGSFSVVIPSYRATKDISGPHDIVEEVARLHGFNNIPATLPSFARRSHSLLHAKRETRLKNYCAYAANMKEQRNYAFFSEPLLAQLGWNAPEGVYLKNPVSSDAYRLVSSLIPHLFENVMNNIASHDDCSFFEWGTVWDPESHKERKNMSGVWFVRRGGLDFYQLKWHIDALFRIAGVSVVWQKAAETDAPQWLDCNKGATLLYKDKVVGVFGKVAALMVERMGGLSESECFAFELDASFLRSHHPSVPAVKEERKHQHSTFDVSVLVPADCTVATLEAALGSADALVQGVSMIDYFEKKEWAGKRSVAFRIVLSHVDRTVTRDEFEKVRNQSIAILTSHGAELRS